MADQHTIQLIVDTVRAEQGFRQLRASGQKYEESLQKLGTTEQALNALGLKSQAQIIRDIQLRRQLIQQLGTSQPQAVATLTAEVEQMNQVLAGTAVNSRQAEQALFNVGFILDDTRQFAVSSAAGFRAIANNIQPLIQQFSLIETKGGTVGEKFKALGASLKGPAGLIVGMNLLFVAVALLPKVFEEVSDKMTDQEKEAKRLKEQYGSLVGQILLVKEAERDIFGEQTQEQAERLAAGFEELIERTRNQIAATDASLRTWSRYGEAVAEVSTMTKTQEEQYKRLNDDLEIMIAEYNHLSEAIATNTVVRRAQALASEVGAEEISNETKLMSELGQEVADLNEEYLILLALTPERVKAMTETRKTLEEQIKALKVLYGLEEKSERRRSSGRLPPDKPDPLTKIDPREFVNTNRTVAELLEDARIDQQEMLGLVYATGQGRRDEELALRTQTAELERQLALMEDAKDGVVDSSRLRTLPKKGDEEAKLRLKAEEARLKGHYTFWRTEMKLTALTHKRVMEEMNINTWQFLLLTNEGIATLRDSFGGLFGGMTDLMQGFYNLSGQQSKKWFGRMKAFAVAEAIVNTYVGATKALAQGGIFGYIAAAGVIASGMGHVATIVAAEPGTNSSSGGGSSGPYGGSGFNGSGGGTGRGPSVTYGHGGTGGTTYSHSPVVGYGSSGLPHYGRSLNAPVLAGASSGMGIHVTFDEPVVSGDKMKLAIKSYEVRLRR